MAEPGPTRTLLIELFALANVGGLSVDVYLAHRVTEFRTGWEWVPVWFAAAGAAVLAGAVVALWIGGRGAPLWRWPGHLVGWGAIIVGVTGLILHLDSQFFEQRTLRGLVYTAPFAAPLAFSGVGLLLLMNRMVEPTSHEWSQWVILLALGGFAGNFVLALADHAQNGFFDQREWVPVISAAVAVGFLVVPIVMRVSAVYLWCCMLVMAWQVIVGLCGFVYHVAADIHGVGGFFESLKYGAPPFAPLLFVDLSLLAMIGLCAAARDEPAGARSVPAGAA